MTFTYIQKILGKNFNPINAFVIGYKIINFIKKLKKQHTTVLAILFITFLSSCTSYDKEQEEHTLPIISLSFSPDNIAIIQENCNSLITKAETNLVIPDTNDFILQIINKNGSVAYSGTYGNRPTHLSVDPGTYTISTFSRIFDKPAFNVPQFGDTKEISVGFGEIANVQFNCSQKNVGVRLLFNESFIEKYNGGSIKIASIVSSTSDTLDYSLNQTDYAYFFPGVIKLFAAKENSRILLTARNFAAGDMHTITLDVMKEQFSINIDTTRRWSNETFILGASANGSTATLSIPTNELANYFGCTNMWVEGYIVGTLETGGKFSPYNPNEPTTKNTNIALSNNPNAQSVDECISIELSKQAIKNALNLADNPNNYQKFVKIKGSVETYMGITGISNITDYILE